MSVPFVRVYVSFCPFLLKRVIVSFVNVSVFILGVSVSFVRVSVSFLRVSVFLCKSVRLLCKGVRFSCKIVRLVRKSVRFFVSVQLLNVAWQPEDSGCKTTENVAGKEVVSQTREVRKVGVFRMVAVVFG